jgi:hypothetical protein
MQVGVVAVVVVLLVVVAEVLHVQRVSDVPYAFYVGRQTLKHTLRSTALEWTGDEVSRSKSNIQFLSIKISMYDG